ncbi:hypothetical protein HDU98_000591 [Podochytrium sp. JEL0797]|nr:hypothetical protein HDU98_000591 [Podochytrium sp. JEL0797]
MALARAKALTEANVAADVAAVADGVARMGVGDLFVARTAKLEKLNGDDEDFLGSLMSC